MPDEKPTINAAEALRRAMAEAPTSATKVAHLGAYRTRLQRAEHAARHEAMGKVLKELLALHEAGQLEGMIYCVRIADDGQSRMGALGSLRGDAALAASARMAYRLASSCEDASHG